MKTILVDAIGCLVSEEGELFPEMHELLETFPNGKIILTGANDEQMEKFGLNKMPYEVFTLKHDPEKTNPEYFKKMMARYDLEAENLVYFEHNPEVVQVAESLGIKSYHYDNEKKDLEALEKFLNQYA